MPASFQPDLWYPGTADIWAANLQRFPALQRANRNRLDRLQQMNASINFPDEGLSIRLTEAFDELDSLFTLEREIYTAILAAVADAKESGKLKPEDMAGSTGLGEFLTILAFSIGAALVLAGSLWGGSFWNASNNDRIVRLDANGKNHDLAMNALQADIAAKKAYNAANPTKVPVGPAIPVIPSNPAFTTSANTFADQALGLGKLAVVGGVLYLASQALGLFKGKK